jgi:hypothetical protein
VAILFGFLTFSLVRVLNFQELVAVLRVEGALGGLQVDAVLDRLGLGRGRVEQPAVATLYVQCYKMVYFQTKNANLGKF